MVAMVASASGYGTLRRFLSAPEGQGSDEGMPSASVSVSVRDSFSPRTPKGFSATERFYAKTLVLYEPTSMDLCLN